MVTRYFTTQPIRVICAILIIKSYYFPNKKKCMHKRNIETRFVEPLLPWRIKEYYISKVRVFSLRYPSCRAQELKI